MIFNFLYIWAVDSTSQYSDWKAPIPTQIYFSINLWRLKLYSRRKSAWQEIKYRCGVVRPHARRVYPTSKGRVYPTPGVAGLSDSKGEADVRQVIAVSTAELSSPIYTGCRARGLTTPHFLIYCVREACRSHCFYQVNRYGVRGDRDVLALF